MIFGPPAVGKMTIGRRVVERTGFRLLHNHALIEPLLEVFDYGTPPFVRLLREMRRRVVEEAAAFGTDLVLTYVWGLELEEDVEELSQQIAPYVDRGGGRLLRRAGRRPADAARTQPHRAPVGGEAVEA